MAGGTEWVGGWVGVDLGGEGWSVRGGREVGVFGVAISGVVS